MKQKEWLLDHLIKEAIEQDMNESPSPLRSKEATWAVIQQHLQQPKRRSRPRPIRFSVAALMIVLLFSLLAFQEKPVRAWNWVVSYFEEIQGSITQIFITRGTAPQQELPSFDSLQFQSNAIHYEAMDLDEAKALSSFPIHTPKDLPGQYTLQHVNVGFFDQDFSDQVELVYSDGTMQFSIRQFGFIEHSHTTITLDHEDIQVRSEIIGGTEVYWLMDGEGWRNMMWSTEKQQYIIEGQLSEEEMLLIFHSMS